MTIGKKLVKKLGPLPLNQFNEYVFMNQLLDTIEGTDYEVETKQPIGHRTVGHDKSIMAIVKPKVDKKKIKMVMIGKGILFDTGGYNIKTGGYMLGMKFDKMGAITLLGVLANKIKKKAPLDTAFIFCIASNLIDENRTVPEDIIKYPNGLRVEITNTDAEGRIVLADGLLEAQKQFPKAKLLDLATLTGAVSYAVGEGVIGGFTNDEKFLKKIQNISKTVIWHLPLLKQHTDALKHPNKDICDIRNLGMGNKAGASTAAAFLKKFVKRGRSWVHLDIAAAADKDGHATGILVDELSKI